MKKRLMIYGACAVMLLTACSDWLDVRPRTEMKEEDLYSSEEGFKNTLMGAYIQLASEDLYGKWCTMMLPEYLAQHWILPTDQTLFGYNIGRYDYTHQTVKPQFEKVWKKYYQCVVHLNNVLYNLEHTGVAFSYQNDKLIKGEALGLRALIHLELLRIFGPEPMKATAGDKAIPYVEEMTKDPNKLITRTYGEVIEYILRDLDTAENLLKEVDPILYGSNYQLNNPSVSWKDAESKPQDEWQYYRQERFNYYAVLGVKARYYHWIGKPELAVKYANLVIDAKNKADDMPKFELMDESALRSGGDLVMFKEHLFGVENSDLQHIVNPLFQVQEAALSQTPTNLDVAYESAVYPDDIRYKGNRYWEERTYSNSAKTNHFRKYTGNDEIAAKNIVPVIRLAEMYMIVMEDASYAEARKHLTTYRIARGLDIMIEEEITPGADRVAFLEKEYRKEFFGEGQMFFFYKRHSYTELTWPKTLQLPARVYTIPLPESQSVFE